MMIFENKLLIIIHNDNNNKGFVLFVDIKKIDPDGILNFNSKKISYSFLKECVSK